MKLLMNQLCPISLVTSAAVTRFKAVKRTNSTAETVKLCDTAGEQILGIVDTGYASGEVAVIYTDGVCALTAGGAIAVGDLIAVDASARGIKATNAHSYVIGTAVTSASAAGVVFSVKLGQYSTILPADSRTFVKAISISYADGTSENDTSFDLPTNANVVDVWLDVDTAEATGTTKTIDFGTLSTESGGDADGFADAIVVDTIGRYRPGATVTTGSNEVYYSANTRGVLLSDFNAGTDVATDVGLYNEKPYLDGDTRSVSWTPGSADFAEFTGTLYIKYDSF